MGCVGIPEALHLAVLSPPLCGEMQEWFASGKKL
jgi:hypothetical protein